MSINFNDLNSGLINLVSDLVGTRLSQMRINAQGDTRPTVLPNRNQVPQKDYPYAIVDHVGVQRVGYNELYSFINDDGDEETWIDYKARFTVSIHSSTEYDTQGIAEEFRSRLFTRKGQALFDQYLDASFLNVGDIAFIPSFKATDWKEVATMTVDTMVRSRIIDIDPAVITDIDVSGELYQDIEDGEPIANVDIKVGPNL